MVFLLGVQHAAEPDHLVAMATQSIRTRSLWQSAWLGGLWGLGHSLVLLVVGAVLLVMQWNVPQRFTLTFEAVVGAMVVFLGARLFVDVCRGRIHQHVHTHDGVQHVHVHSHRQRVDHHHGHVSFVTGVVHGLAGSAGVVVLVASTFSSVSKGIGLIGLFGLGSILGMIGLSMVVSMPTMLFPRAGALHRVFMGSAAVVSIGIGLQLCYNIIRAF